MNYSEIVSNIVIAMINSKMLTSTENVTEAYKKIYDAVINPDV